MRTIPSDHPLLTLADQDELKRVQQPPISPPVYDSWLLNRTRADGANDDNQFFIPTNNHPQHLKYKPDLAPHSSQPTPQLVAQDLNLPSTSPFDLRPNFSPFQDLILWKNDLGLKELTDSGSHPSIPDPVDSDQTFDHLGILDHLRSDQDILSVHPHHPDHLGSDWPGVSINRRLPPSLDLARSMADKISGNNPNPQHEELPCSSCGLVKPRTELSRLWPCFHPHCNTCINTLINASCNDPPPPQMVCFLCSQHVTGFDPPISFHLSSPNMDPSVGSDEWSSFPDTVNLKCLALGFDNLAIESYKTAPLSSEENSPVRLGSFSSTQSGGSSGGGDEAIASFVNQSIALPFTTSAPKNSCPWPIIRVDNIAWSLTVADIVEWLAECSRCLPPPELCPLPIHILCTPTDGKTLNHCFIETSNLAAAHFLVRERHGSKIANRPCSVVLTSSSEFHAKVLGIQAKKKANVICDTIELILKLCAPHIRSSIKAPERPFFHLMSILSHYQHLSEGEIGLRALTEAELNQRWTSILQLAIQCLFTWKTPIENSMDILRVMVDVGISSPLIDKPAIFRFLSQGEKLLASF